MVDIQCIQMVVLGIHDSLQSTEIETPYTFTIREKSYRKGNSVF